MKKEAIPVKIADKIIEQCSRIVPDVKPEYVLVTVQEWSRLRECFSNVERMIQE